MTLHLAARLAILSFVISSMFSVGLGLSLSQIVDSLRSRRLIVSALVANFIVVPTLSYLITKLIPLNESFVIGMLLLGTGAGAPFLPKLAEFAKGNLAFAVGLMVMLMTFTIVYMPVVLPLLIPAAHVSSWSVAKPLVTVMFPPLALGLLVRGCSEAHAKHWEPYLRRASTFALVLAVVLVLWANYSELHRTIDFNAIASGVLLILVSFGCGFALGGRTPDLRNVLAFGTAQRDISAALLVAVKTFSDSRIAVMLVLMILLGVFLEIPIALVLGRYGARRMPRSA